MKRMHIHVGVDNIEQSVRFYSALFGTEPAKRKPDYAKWMLDDPRLNFAISTRAKRGVDHLGLQVEEDQELDAMRERLKAADLSVFDEGETVCCYAKSDKSWVTDPSGIAWEAYQTMGDAMLFSQQEETRDSACCSPAAQNTSGCGEPQPKSTGCCSK